MSHHAVREKCGWLRTSLHSQSHDVVERERINADFRFDLENDRFQNAGGNGESVWVVHERNAVALWAPKIDGRVRCDVSGG